ncbi:class I SAM-dependent methyltransferase [Rhizobium sp. Root1220]|uniref:class I SAM-dependent methyltransferase n=1 Tax=Rhizobium sp. Root1220 TaxID=1736432 RepID=UPI00070063E4|nr:class I SAM-dependent methyltransferase [Rhizobium sp. Root1220]KQV82098.1 SAM-dependent methyltransferase [Rhizobium sp. Root1220]
MSGDEKTSSFYDENAATYASRQRTLPIRRLDAFLSLLPPGAAVLELGCGGGQDSAYMLSKGFDVTPTDGSVELAREAESLLGHPVVVMRFEELDEDSLFDGVWSEASLLHVPLAVLPGILERIRRALKAGGAFHATFKAGETEGRDGFGRFYNYPSAELLSEMLSDGGWHNVVITEGDGSGYDRMPTRWLVVRAQK